MRGHARGLPACRTCQPPQSRPASGPGLLGGRHLRHRAEALVAGGRGAWLVWHDGIPVCWGNIGPCGRGAQAQLLCFDGACAQRIQALWRGPAWQQQSGFKPSSGLTILAEVRQRCACVPELARKALARCRALCRSTGVSARRAGARLAVDLPQLQLLGPAHSASIPQDAAWGCGGVLTCPKGSCGPAAR